MLKRPSKKEVDKRLREAKRFLKDKGIWFANPNKAVGEISDLSLGDSDCLKDLIFELLVEISLGDYAGSYPPKKSYESLIADCELWAFTWASHKMKKEMYLKFALKSDCFYLVSIHRGKKKD